MNIFLLSEKNRDSYAVDIVFKRYSYPSMKKHLFSILIFFLPAFVFAQDVQPKSGAQVTVIGITDETLFDKLMATMPFAGSGARETLQQQSVKPYMMPVRKMGARGTEMSYALATCLEFYVNLGRNYKENLSPDYISLNLRNAGRSLNLKEAFQFLVENGTISAAILPYDADAITSAVHATPKYRIRNYLHLFRDVTPGRMRSFETRKALMRGNPVLVELETDDQIKSLAGERTWSPDRNPTGAFPLIVVGFDELQGAFEVLSCWGSDWGNDGYIWIKYSDFEKYATNGYVMIPEESY